MDNSTAARRHRTPDQVLGPYFPTGQTQIPTPQVDLTSVNGVEGHAQGEIIEVTGRVLNLDGDPVRGIPITVWQANTFGRYTHGNDPNPAPLDLASDPLDPLGGGGTGFARISPLAVLPQLLSSRLTCEGGGATTAGTGSVIFGLDDTSRGGAETGGATTSAV